MSDRTSLHPKLKQFRSGPCLSYVLMDPVSRKAVLIDPILELIGDYRAFLAERHLAVEWVIDTQTHTEHLSASHLLQAEFGAKIGMSARTSCHRVTHPLKDGEVIQSGDLRLEVWDTPGHTRDSICLKWDGSIFTGDTLLAKSPAEVEYPEGSPEDLWKSQHRLRDSLPPQTLIFPSHDSLDLVLSTLEVESKKNPDLRSPGFEEFRESKLRFGTMPTLASLGDERRKCLEFNLEKTPAELPAGFRANRAHALGAEASRVGSMAAISVQKFAAKLKATHAPSVDGGTVFLDVREPEEVALGRIPKTLNMPLSEFALRFSELKKASRIYVSCQSGRRSAMVVTTLNYLDFPDVVNVSGGYQAWVQAGYPIEKD